MLSSSDKPTGDVFTTVFQMNCQGCKGAGWRVAANVPNPVNELLDLF
jgi:hypothetical protein